MRYVAVVLISLVLAVNAAFSQPMPREALLEDLFYFRDNLVSKHINPFAHLSRSALDEMVGAIEARAGQSTQYEFLFALSGIMRAIGDEHGVLQMPYPTTLPIRFRSFSDGIFITAIAPGLSEHIMQQLISIDGHPVDSIRDRLRLVIQYENPSYFETRFEEALSDPSVLFAAGVLARPDAARLKLQIGDSGWMEIDIPVNPGSATRLVGLPKTKGMLAYQYAKQNYWYQHDSSNNLMYVHYRRCVEMIDSPFPEFNKTLFAAIEQLRPGRLVLDLRFNSGGNSAILEPFLTAVKRSYLNNPGKFYVLIGKQTFSSALMNAVRIKQQTHAILVGEPTSGNINHFGERREFVLPNSKAVVSYSTRYRETWKGKKGPLQPDIRISYSAASFKAGRDEALDRVMND